MRKNRRHYFLLVAAMIALGLIWRLAPLGLPWFLYKYGGSIIWGAMVYFIVAGFLPGRSAVFSMLTAGVVAALSELFRLYHTPSLDAFRATLAGALLLGRMFSVWNIVAYGVGIAVVGLLDRGKRDRNFL